MSAARRTMPPRWIELTFFVRGWMSKINVQSGGMALDTGFFLEFEGMRTHQTRLEGGDASSDSYCYA